ncbi:MULTISPECIES: zinc ribbon domain-containing protein [Paenibacillus]|uniref:Zinc ribbon domain-containing protein n=1 Tax=Paenibacillus campinasensis TaxID=66347 RepID=A0A268EQP8_9BACL|nr:MULTISPECIES: zinc ribbon domain-containing protein [Paenibacillus]MUG65443.1 zinc ribbon domain-containing protein [Paenibacillus campinasensis]PAD75448.1 hypothetical protein CHH67_14650 [Paenibacillus campinasensis]PAK51434.1 hypothetical protein CHH75_14665 [Paenibacillus sp. 7541]
MKILQRLKDGANKATEKAQHVVEINKMNSQIAEIEQQKNAYFQEMGKVFYEGYRSQDMSVAEKEMVELAQVCDGLQEQIHTLRNRIAIMKNERLCECGRVVGLDANFCPYCGNKLEKLTRNEPKPEAQPVQRERERVLPFEDEHEHEEEHAVQERFEYRPVSGPAEPEAEIDPEVEVDPEQLFREEEERERERRHLEELERERERQLELDRRIRFWQENNQFQDQKPDEESARDTVKCQICSVDLAKGSKWCPRCGAEQI